jgi:hypothetical protein
MPKLQQRMITAGPYENENYRYLTRVAKANDCDTAEEFLGKILEVILSGQDDSLRWVPVALTKSDLNFAAEKWGEEYPVMLDETLAEGLGKERATTVAKQGRQGLS